MKKLFYTLMIIFVFSSFTFGSARILRVKGRVKAKVRGRWKRARTGMMIPNGTKLYTASGAQVVVKLQNGSVIRLSPLTQLTITSKTNATNLRLSVGRIRAQVKKGSASFKVHTLTGHAGVRGTDLEVSYYEDAGMKCYVHRGVVVLQGRDRSRITLRKGDFSRIKKRSVSSIMKVRKESFKLNISPEGLTDKEKDFLMKTLDPAGLTGEAGSKILKILKEANFVIKKERL